MMAATLGGLVRSVLGAAGITLPVSMDETRDKAPDTFPYITVSDGVTRVRHPNGAPSVISRSELIQVDVWQKRDPTAEDSTIPLAVERALNAAASAQLTNNGGTVYRMVVESSRRMFEKDTRIVHDALSVRVTRRI